VYSNYTTRCHTVKAYETKRNILLYATQICLFKKWVVVVVVLVVVVIMTMMASTVQKKMDSLWYIFRR